VAPGQREKRKVDEWSRSHLTRQREGESGGGIFRDSNYKAEMVEERALDRPEARGEKKEDYFLEMICAIWILGTGGGRESVVKSHCNST